MTAYRIITHEPAPRVPEGFACSTDPGVIVVSNPGLEVVSASFPQCASGLHLTAQRPIIYLTHISEEHDSVHLNVSDMVDGEVCAGAHAGRILLAKLMASCAGSPTTAEPVFIDFGSIDLATASFLRESVLGLRTLLRGRKANYYPIVANANALIADELEILLAPDRDALLACTLENDGGVTNVRLLGRLEDKQRRVFEMVENRGETDAGELQQEFGASEGVQQTAWNNRLATLAGLGLIVEISRGRAKRYRALLMGD